MKTPLPLGALILLLAATSLSAQDIEFIRALEDAQRERPAAPAATARIAPPTEPGDAFVIRGQVFDTDGRTLVPGAVIFAYHTDRDGHYDKPGAGPHRWRLRGWATADASGRFEFRTIRPAPYPGRKIAAHVHFTLFMPSGARYHAGELQFADDPLVPASDLAAAAKLGAFGSVQPVGVENGVQHVSVRLKPEPRHKF